MKWLWLCPLSCKTCIHVPGLCESGQKEEWKQEDSSMVKRLHCELPREEWRYCMSGVFTSFWLTSCHQWPHWTKQKQNTHCSHSKLLSHNAQGHRVGGHGSIFKQWDNRDTETLLWQSVTSSLRPKDAVVLAGVQEAGCRCLLVATVLLIVKWKTHSQQSHGYTRLNSIFSTHLHERMQDELITKDCTTLLHILNCLSLTQNWTFLLI